MFSFPSNFRIPRLDAIRINSRTSHGRNLCRVKDNVFTERTDLILARTRQDGY